jgi:endonuclease/exonuclease/phosphatase family metal-dependent hydrolase
MAKSKALSIILIVVVAFALAGQGSFSTSKKDIEPTSAEHLDYLAKVLTPFMFQGTQCWLVQTPFPINDIHLTVRTVNMASSQLDDYNMRQWGIAQQFKIDWASGQDIIGIQEAKENMSDCVAGVTQTTGASCFGSAMAQNGLGPSYSVVRTEASGSSQLGIIIGKDWKLLASEGWRLGKDSLRHLGSRSTRRLIEAVVRHKDHGWTLRFYTTHLSHGADQKEQRLDQIDRLREIIAERVDPGELPPVVVGDFNFRKEESESYQKMNAHFQLVNELAIGCLTDGKPTEAGIDHIWVGRKTAFPQTTGTFVPLRYHTTAANGSGVDLKSQRTVDPVRGQPAYTGALSDHNSPGFSFKIVDMP